jgi:hypothetical protein
VNSLADLRQVELPRVLAGAQVMLEKAEDAEESAEKKRRRAASYNARQNQGDNGTGDPWSVVADPTKSEGARRDMLRELMRK